MKFYDAYRPLYLETDVQGVGLRGRLLQLRDGMNSGQDKVPDNLSLCSIAFASKSYQVVHFATVTQNEKTLEYCTA